jgi:16S rRNA (adenine1518-N6/adenine1519-N6)-dimethyltransferase
MRPPIRPLKGLGQHFLTDRTIAKKIADTLVPGLTEEETILEIGPGTGVLTEYLVEKSDQLFCIEIDDRSVEYLERIFPELKNKIILDDFLTSGLTFLNGKSFSVIGNFPYNISSQILFRVIDEHLRIPQVVGMFQKEVAQRITSPPGNKNYGIPSVLLQAHFDCEYLFTVPPTVFEPPPKVESAVIRLIRKNDFTLPCDAALFKKIVKTGFNQRRKTLRNSLKSILPIDKSAIPYLDKRPEQLHFTQFIELAQLFAAGKQQ